VTDRCGCVAGPDGTVCNAEIDKGYVRCRPCAVGNHERRVCRHYLAVNTAPHLDRRCVTCGFDSAMHPVPIGAL
jgi:hypothetical protein